MTERPRYSVEEDLSEAEAAARDLHDQIARIREKVEAEKRRLGGEPAPDHKPT